MTNQQTLDFLFTQLPLYQNIGTDAYKPGLGNTLALDDYFGHPHLKFRTVHVAGTNGKGSVSHITAAILQKAGYKVGLYTSPHLKDFRERIRIDGQMIPESEVVGFVERHRQKISEIAPSFFEMATLMAFDWFARNAVDVAVVEVGLGGRLDSTNIITPLVSIITNISFDHTAMLGDTLAAIAGEKAGIIKPSVPVVVGQSHPETDAVFEAKAAAEHSPLVFADRIRCVESATLTADRLNLAISHNGKPEYDNLQLDLMGCYQRKNILTVLAAFDVLRQKLTVDECDIIAGAASTIATTGLKGRWQKLSDCPPTYCDTGHNDDGIRQVVEQLKLQKYNHLHIVIGMVSDKDHAKVLGQLPTDATYYFTNAQVPRALPAADLAAKAAAFGLHGQCYATIPQAIEAAQKNAAPNDFIFIGGSTFTVAEIPNL